MKRSSGNPDLRLSGPLLREMADLVQQGATATSKIASLAGREAKVDPSLLGGFLDAVLSSARRGTKFGPESLSACHKAGVEAAEQGVRFSALVDLHLSAAWRLWREIAFVAGRASPEAIAAVADAMFRSVDDAVAALAKGHEEAQRRIIRREEGLRREFVDDLLGAAADSEALAERAVRFGFNLAGTHLVVVACTHRPLADAGLVHARVETQVVPSFGGRDVMVATKEGLLVCVFPAPTGDPVPDLVRILEGTGEGPWQLGVGRAYAGPGGIMRSYDEAREALDLATRLGLDSPVVRLESLLPYRVIAKDRAAVSEMVGMVLGPLHRARRGAEPLIETLEAFLAESGNASATARRLHLSPRAVTYRLERIGRMTGYSPLHPDQRFILELAVRALRLIRPI
ncbi:MAG: helix-turn-helix domain-containing protein [Actinomycetota bacterium]